MKVLDQCALIVLLGAECIVAKLVLHDLEEVFKDDFVDYKRLKAEAELIKTTRIKSKRCPDVNESIELFQVWIDTPAGLVSELIETASYIDSIDDQDRIYNALEPWIYMDIVLRPLMNCLPPEHPKLQKHLLERILHPPSALPYNWSTPQPNLSGQFGQPHFLDMVIFKGQVKNGFFIEAGADDFESDSNTIYFELKHNWTGLLVEPNPTIFPLGLMKRRKAWGAGTCLGLTEKPSIANFAQKAVEMGMAGLIPEERENSFRIQCFPVLSLILATGNRTVNYLSLDIEGAELQVLQSIPWDKVDIEVLTIESNHVGEVFPGTQEDLRKFMEEKGYVLAYTVEIDDVFVRRDLYEGKYKPDLKMIKKFENLFAGICSWEDKRSWTAFYRVVTHALSNISKKAAVKGGVPMGGQQSNQ